MIQKVIKVGNSLAVTIPQKEVKERNLKVGDMVSIEIEVTKKGKKITLTREFADWVDDYIEKNRPALEELSNT